MTSYQKLQWKQYARISKDATPGGRFWANLKDRRATEVKEAKQAASVTYIDFSEATPHDYAVTSSTRVTIFDTSSHRPKKVLARFKSVAHSGSFRADGKLLVAGEESGFVKVFDLQSRSVLRLFSGHRGAVHVAKFSPAKTLVMSASDDCTVRCWDIPTQEQIFVAEGHQDYIRTGAISAGGSNMWVTGSYDHTVKLWDAPRTSDCVMILDHGSPVEAVLTFPSGGLVLSAGTNVIKVWDVLGGGRLLHHFSNHQKTITSICLSGDGAYLLSGGLDNMVKVYDVTTYAVVHTMKFAAPVTSLAVSMDSQQIAVGMSDGGVAVRTRSVKSASGERGLAVDKALSSRSGSYRYMLRGQSSRPAEDDYTVERQRQLRLKPYDRYLKKFQYQNALDEVIKEKHPVLIVSMLDELMARNGLHIALAGRDDASLAPILTFLCKYSTHPRYSPLLLQVSSLLLDLYTQVIRSSSLIDRLLRRLQRRWHEELRLQEDLLSLLGSLDLIFSAASHIGVAELSTSSLAVAES
mmetsp:Transcript_22774/g.37487  ORF Transcript_22774/g.37487 Transcript_22774/m.37487 type:complete len:522 (+) Transcript_22774:136-1701(+)|eukprot:CAMPEP_0184666216 /NCGR_PEP_ID=MMETSP0308-20130426/60416_1 /TAXON_ID=38269 /ORGANISM="Gloeochaete witrockiana, Strain SAG 46.84" /LENGTH=521 /DNA_ID=CAMNT_0027110673 /DNA_START=77 /DNA_END=1642 /DNA_ORIENTATION=-